MLTREDNKRYITALADGKLHEKVSEGTEGAELREYETRDGKKGSKWELTYKSIDNVLVKNVYFEDREYGKNILLDLTDGENEITFVQGVKGNFGEDLMKKLPNVDFSAKLSIKPYAFVGDDGKKKMGVNIFQGDKLMNYFWDFDAKKPLHGMPEPEGDKSTYDSDDWQMYYTKVRKFLIAYTEEHILPQFKSLADAFVEHPEELEGKGIKYPEEEINPEDVPF